MSSTNTASVTAAPLPSRLKTHCRYISQNEPHFEEFYELPSSGSTRRMMAGEGATITFASEDAPMTIEVAPLAIVLVKRSDSHRTIDIPVERKIFDGELGDGDALDLQPSRIGRATTKGQDE